MVAAPSFSRWPLLLAALLASRVAVAAPPPAPDAEAVAFFDEGRKLMAEGKHREAIARFEESLRHARTVGALLNLGRCYDEAGRAASAWATYRAAGSLARELHDAREADASRFAEAARAHVSTLTLDASAVVSEDGVQVKRDGMDVGVAARGDATPVDPGEHLVEVTARGRVPWHGTVRVKPNGDAATLRIPALALAPRPAPDGASALRAARSTPEEHASDAPPGAPPSHAARTLGFLTLGAGVVGVGVGAVAGLFAIQKHHDATSACASYPDHCASSGAADGPNASSQTWATVSTVGFIAGGAAIASGVVLLLTAPGGEPSAPSRARVTPLVLAGGAGVAVGGAW